MLGFIRCEGQEPVNLLNVTRIRSDMASATQIEKKYLIVFSLTSSHDSRSIWSFKEKSVRDDVFKYICDNFTTTIHVVK